MSFSPTTSGDGVCADRRRELRGVLVGEVCESTTFRPGCVALNSLTSATPTPLVAARSRTGRAVRVHTELVLGVIRADPTKPPQATRATTTTAGRRSERAVSNPFASSVRHLSQLVSIHVCLPLAGGPWPGTSSSKRFAKRFERNSRYTSRQGPGPSWKNHKRRAEPQARHDGADRRACGRCTQHRLVRPERQADGLGGDAQRVQAAIEELDYRPHGPPGHWRAAPPARSGCSCPRRLGPRARPADVRRRDDPGDQRARLRAAALDDSGRPREIANVV